MKKLFLLLTTLTIFCTQLFGQGQVPLSTNTDYIEILEWTAYNDEVSVMSDWSYFSLISFDGNDVLWGVKTQAQTNNKQLFSFDETLMEWEYWDYTNSDMPDEHPHKLWVDKIDNKKWILFSESAGSSPNKIISFDGLVWETFESSSLFNNEEIVDFATYGNNMYVTTINGVYVYQDEQWDFTSNDDIVGGSADLLALDGNSGVIYLSTKGSQLGDVFSIFKYNNNLWELVLQDPWLEQEEITVIGEVQIFYCDFFGNIIFHDDVMEGLYRYDVLAGEYFPSFMSVNIYIGLATDAFGGFWAVDYNPDIQMLNTNGETQSFDDNPLIETITTNSMIQSISTSESGKVVVGGLGLYFYKPEGIKGVFYHDENQNNIRDAEEDGLQGIYCSVDTFYNYSQSGGLFTFLNGDGVYDIEILSDYWEASNPSELEGIIVDVADTNITYVELGLYLQENVPDAMIDIAPQLFVAGFDEVVHVSYTNLGSQSMDGEVKLVLSPYLLDVSTNPEADNVVGDTLVWNYADLEYGDLEQIVVYATTDVDALDLDVDIYAEITSNVGDSLWSNNVDEIRETIVGSYDPNDKQVYPMGECDAQLTQVDEQLEYLIRFQNTGTYPATNVSIWDTLSPYLDLSTLVITSASHDVEADFVDDRFIRFNFFDIMLPDSNSNEPESHGFVKYRIAAKDEVAFGSEVTNTAHIFFDFNAPIVTNTTLNVLVDSVPLPPVFTITQNGDSIFVPEDDNLDYQWHNGGGVIVINETGFWLTPEWEGAYSVLVTDSNGCAQMSNLYDFSFVALDEHLQSAATLAPNPFTDFTILSFDQPQKNVRVELIDIQGRVQKVYLLNGSELRVERDGLPAGMYLLRIAEESVNKIIIE